MSRFRLRFSIKLLFALMALCAICLLPVIQQRNIKTAREHFDLTCTRWDLMIVTLEDVLAASERVASAEANSLWYSSATAHARHQARMDDILSDAEYRQRTSYHPERTESYLKYLEGLRLQVREFEP